MHWELIGIVVGNIAALALAAGNLVAFLKVRSESEKLKAEAGKVNAEAASIKVQADELVFDRLILLIERLEIENTKLRKELGDCERGEPTLPNP